MNALEYHPLSQFFPLLTKPLLDDLAENIKDNGLKLPIILYEGKILDGRNRYQACKLVDIKPEFEKYSGENPLEYVISLNLKRRHLDESQRAMVAAKMANKPEGRPNKTTQICVVSIPEAAKLLNVSARSVDTAKSILKQAPDLVEVIESGKKTVHDIAKKIKKDKKRKEESQCAKEVVEKARNNLKDVCRLEVGPMEDWLPKFKGIDVIITDPPYPEKFLPLYGKLAELSKNIPLVAVMCGQSYLPQIITDMSQHLKYRWTMAYLTPGQAMRQWERKIDCAWKPVLLFGTKSDYVFDVVKSDAPDKEHHDWGQSESGMERLVNALTKPGQLICDPFLGAGTTAIVCLVNGRRFVGCDTDQMCINSTWKRLESVK